MILTVKHNGTEIVYDDTSCGKDQVTARWNDQLPRVLDMIKEMSKQIRELEKQKGEQK